MSTDIVTYTIPTWLAREKGVTSPVTGTIEKETEKAINLRLLGPQYCIWLPKSQLNKADPEPKKEAPPEVPKGPGPRNPKKFTVAIETDGEFCSEGCPLLEDPYKSHGHTWRYCKLFTQGEADEDGLFKDEKTGRYYRSPTCYKACGDSRKDYKEYTRPHSLLGTDL